MIRVSQIYQNRKNNIKRGFIPTIKSKYAPYEVRFPELVDMAFNKVWGDINV